MNRRTSSGYGGAALLAIMLLALVLRLIGVDGPPLKLWDDFISLAIADQPGPGAVIRQLLGQQQPFVDFQPPLYPLLIHFVLDAARTDVAVRLPAVLSGTLAVPAMYLLARRLFSRESALFSCLLLAVSVYQIEYSQQVRPYALFLTLSILSMWLFHRLAAPGSTGARWKGDLAGYVVASLAMCFTSYLGLLNLLCQGVWLGGRLALRRDRASARGLGGLALCGAGFLPWLLASTSARSVVSGGSGEKSHEIGRLLWDACREFFSYYNEYLSLNGGAIPFLALIGLGLVAALVRRRESLAFLACWMIVPLLAMLLRETGDHHLRVRYLTGLYASLTLLAGAGVECVVSLVARPGQRRFFALGVVVLAAANLINWPAYSYFYRRPNDGLKDLALVLNGLDAQPGAVAVAPGSPLWSPALLTRALSWYLPGRFEPLAGGDIPPYRRVAVLVPSGTALDPVKYGATHFVRRFRGMDIYVAGMANRSPVPLVPGGDGVATYRIATSSPEVFSDAVRAVNVRQEGGGLAPDVKEAPGDVAFRFVRPDMGRVTQGGVTVAAAFTPSINARSDATVTVQVRAGQGEWREAGALRSAEAGAPGGTERTFPLPPEVLEARDFEVRLSIDDTRDYGRMAVTNLSLALSGDPGRSRPDDRAHDRAWLEQQVQGLSARLGARAWSEDTRVLGAGLFTEVPPQSGPIEPVYAARGEDGGILARYFDPGLARPGFALAPGRGMEIACLPPGLKGLRLRAPRVDGVSLGERHTALGVELPPQASVVLGASGPARLEHSPFYDGSAALSGNTATAGALYRKDAEPCLSCRDAAPCAIEYSYASALPMRGLRLEFYPRVSANWRFSNWVKASYSLDGGPFLPLGSFSGSASGSWEGLDVPRVAFVDFAAQASRLTLRFELSGDGAQLWSSPDRPMRLDVFCGAPPQFPASCPALLASDSPVGDAVAYGRDPALRPSLLRGF
jgi:4-amino-4-deoxy-L-arabinose transferase-like glycosyltransferase